MGGEDAMVLIGCKLRAQAVIDAMQSIINDDLFGEPEQQEEINETIQ